MQPAFSNTKMFRMVNGDLLFRNNVEDQGRKLQFHYSVTARLRPNAVFTVHEGKKTFYVNKKELSAALQLHPDAENSLIECELLWRRILGGFRSTPRREIDAEKLSQLLQGAPSRTVDWIQYPIRQILEKKDSTLAIEIFNQCLRLPEFSRNYQLLFAKEIAQHNPLLFSEMISVFNLQPEELRSFNQLNLKEIELNNLRQTIAENLLRHGAAKLFPKPLIRHLPEDLQEKVFQDLITHTDLSALVNNTMRGDQWTREQKLKLCKLVFDQVDQPKSLLYNLKDIFQDQKLVIKLLMKAIAKNNNNWQIILENLNIFGLDADQQVRLIASVLKNRKNSSLNEIMPNIKRLRLAEGSWDILLKKCLKYGITVPQDSKPKAHVPSREETFKAWMEKIEFSRPGAFSDWLKENPQNRTVGFNLIQRCLERFQRPEEIMHGFIAPSIEILELTPDDRFKLAKLIVSERKYKASRIHLYSIPFSEEQKHELASLAAKHFSYEEFNDFCFELKRSDDDRAAFTVPFLEREYFRKLRVPFKDRDEITMHLFWVTPENFSQLMAAWFEALDHSSRFKLLNTLLGDSEREVFPIAQRLASGAFGDNIRPYLKAFSLTYEERDIIEAILLDRSSS